MNKYRLGESVFLIDNSKIHLDTIIGIRLTTKDNKPIVIYTFMKTDGKSHYDYTRYENEIFKSKEELIATL